jgi:hypothetical protein
MTLLGDAEMRADGNRESVLPVQFQPGAIWGTDVALEIWIDVERVPVTIRLAGTLDEATGSTLFSVVEELIADGSREFELQTPTMSVSDPGGLDLLADLQRVVHSAGGRLLWDRSMVTYLQWDRTHAMALRKGKIPRVPDSTAHPA